MIEAGEDPRFIARRVMISAAEDIGMADPQALPIAVAAAEGVALIGMPEGRILLAEAVVYLATAPKSNAAYMALDAAIADVRAGKIGRVPPHLRDAHYPGAKRLGHGKGYVYSHDSDFGVATAAVPARRPRRHRVLHADRQRQRTGCGGPPREDPRDPAGRVSLWPGHGAGSGKVIRFDSMSDTSHLHTTRQGAATCVSDHGGGPMYVREQRQTLPCHWKDTRVDNVTYP